MTGCCQIEDENTGEPAKCTLTYNANGGSGEMKSTTGNKGSEITLAANAFTRTGYTFAEWNTKSSGKGEKYADTAKIKLTANTTLYAQWTRNGYKIIYQPDGGTNTPDNPTNYTIEDSVKLKAPTKTGYTFGGWYETEDFSGNTVTSWKAGEKTEDVTLYAKWTANNYTVTFDKNADDATCDAPADISATYDKDFELPENTFAKIGYNFAGWNTKADGSGTNYEANATVKNFTAENGATVTLYAQWIERGFHKITYALNGGNHCETPTTSFKETEDVTLGKAERTGYTFSGWYEAEDFSGTAIESWKAGEKTEDVTLYAKWTANTYTVKFDKNADDATGDAPADISATYDKDFELPENTFAKIGYNFAGWNTLKNGSGTDYAANTNAKNLTAENGTTVTLYAQWVDRGTHNIVYKLNGGNHSGTQIEQFKETEDVTLGTAERTGYTFSGWYETEDFSGTAVTSWKAGEKTEDVTLYAKWIANTYTVKFDKNADDATGDASADIQATYDVEFSLPENTFAKIGYNFAGWNTKSDGNGTNYEANAKVKNLTTENNATVTLYAKWTANNYTVSFDTNGGTGSMTAQTFTYGTPQALNENKFTRTGYDFAGWATSANGNVTYSDKQNYSIGTEDVTLYAIWRDIISFKEIPIFSSSKRLSPSSQISNSLRKIEKAFWMSDHEVTRGEYKEIMGSDPSTARANDKDGNELTGNAADNNPVNKVSWYDAIVYCNKRSIKEGLTPCYTVNGSTAPDNWGDVPTSSNDTWNAATCDFTANGYRLPTEAEWEWAARGGNDNTTYAGSNNINDVAWYTGKEDTGTTEVKTRKANGYGLYDMSGNVFEWCWDRFSDVLANNPATGAAGGKGRSVRGSSWKHSDFLPVYKRYEVLQYIRYNDFGLRVVRTAEE